MEKITDNIFDLTIIGGGTAGAAAAIYAARKQLKTAIITEEWGGQSIVSDDIQNWIGTPHISGANLAKSLKSHVEEYAGNIVKIVTADRAENVSKENGIITVKTKNGLSFSSRTLLLTVGSIRRKLNATDADKFEHKGLTYCASCDGPLFTGKDVAVIGGGNAGFETAAQLLAYTKTVTLFSSSETFAADPITVAKLEKHPNFRGVKNAETQKILGDKLVSGLVYKDKVANEEKTLQVEGIFIEIGQIPNTAFLNGIVNLTKSKHIITDPKTQRTETEGIWAAGDCTDVLYHQNNIAVGDAVRALEDIYVSLKA